MINKILSEVLVESLKKKCQRTSLWETTPKGMQKRPDSCLPLRGCWIHKEKVFPTRRCLEHASLVSLYPRRTSVSYIDFHFGKAIRSLRCCIHGKTRNGTLGAPAVTYHSMALLKWSGGRAFAISPATNGRKTELHINSIRQVSGACVAMVEEMGQPMTESQITESACPTILSHLDQ